MHNTCPEPKAYGDTYLVSFKITEQQHIEVIVTLVLIPSENWDSTSVISELCYYYYNSSFAELDLS